MRYIYFILAFSLLAGGAFISNAQAAEGMSKSDIEKIVKDYILNNPDVLVESLENYRAQQERQMQTDALENIKKHDAFLTGADAPSVGNPNADVTVVEFFDYNCGYCHRALPDIQTMVKEDSNVRFVFHEFPILSPTSALLAKWSLAAHKQGKYFEYHSALMSKRGVNSPDRLKSIGKDLGLDVAQLEKDANSPAIAAELEKSMTAAREIGIRGTPAFIINGEMYPGYLGEDGLRDAIAKARENSDKKDG